MKQPRLTKASSTYHKFHHLSPIEKRIFGYFIILQLLIYIVIIIYWSRLSEYIVSLMVISVALVIINVLQVMYLLQYFRYRREQQLYENFGFYHLHLAPILSIIQKKEIKLYQMTVDFKNSMPMSREAMESRAQHIVNDCFIQLNFTNDALLNALFFKYYNLFQSRHIELKTLVSAELNIEKAKQVQLYEAVEFCFEIMVWLLSNGIVQEKGTQSKQLKKITFVLQHNQGHLQFNCTYEDEFAELLSILQYVEKEKKKKYRWRGHGKMIHLEVSPSSVSLRGSMKVRTIETTHNVLRT